MSGGPGPVLHFIDTIGPGGAETVFLEVARGLRERGWPGRVVLTGPGWVLDRARDLGLPVDIVETRGRFDVIYLKRLRDLARKHRARLVHAHLFSPAVYASLVGATTGIPVVATFHGASDVASGSWGRRLRLRLVARQARIVCVSRSLRNALQSRVRVPPPGVRVIYNGVDSSEFETADGGRVRSEHGVPADGIVIGSLGNVRPAKDLPTFLRAADDMAGEDPRCRFAVVGQRTEPLHGRLVELRHEMGLDDRVSFWGFRRDVPEVVAAFDVLVISSRTEGFSLATLQAMAAGTPVVATRSGGPEEIITDGIDGLLVPTGAPEALAAAIRRVLDDSDLRSRIVTSARRTVRDRFGLPAMLDAYEAVYAEVGARPPKSAGVKRVTVSAESARASSPRPTR